MRLVHLSDLQMPPLPALPVGAFFTKRCLGWLNWHRKRARHHQLAVLEALFEDIKQQYPDVVIITGDITNLGLPQEWDHARKWLQAKQAEFGMTTQWMVLPGNHDAYRPDSLAPMAQTLQQLNPTLTPNDKNTQLFPLSLTEGHVSLLGLSSATPTHWLSSGGRVCDPQWRVLQEWLETNAQKRRVIAIHHPPLAGQGPWLGRLKQAKPLQQLISKHSIEVVLHGHWHKRVINWAGNVPVLGVGSASGRAGLHDEPASYAILDIPQTGAMNVTWRGLSKNAETFSTIAQRKFTQTEAASLRR
jgi:3',5'-cyclic AMP phosphodiesterase CpdA